MLLNGARPKVARVLDVSYGGVSFLLDGATKLPDTFYARLRVPNLPLADYRVQARNLTNLSPSLQRVGCRFVS